MKTLIERLSKQAGIVDYGINAVDGTTFSERFAELVAKECISILMDGDFWQGAPISAFHPAAMRAEAIHAAFSLPGNGKYAAELPSGRTGGRR